MARFLFPEDEPCIRELCRLTLEFQGHLVDEAENGAEAVGHVEGREYDAIVTDGQMPRMNGLQFLGSVQQVVRHRIPCALKSAWTDDYVLAEGASLGVLWYVRKPFRYQELASACEEMLRVRVRWLLEAQPSIDLPPRADGRWVELEQLDAAAGVAMLPKGGGSDVGRGGRTIRAPSPRAAALLLAGTVRCWRSMLDERDVREPWGKGALSRRPAWNVQEVLLGDAQLRLEFDRLGEPLRTRLYLALCCARDDWRWRIGSDVELVADPPVESHEVDGVLHCETGPALRYRDGWAVHALHGLVCPAA